MDNFAIKIERLKDFLEEDSNFVSIIMNSIHNHLVNAELVKAAEDNHITLVFLGTHSIIQTVSEKIFGRTGVAGTQFYLEKFVDGASEGLRFSLIAKDIHEMRNIFAHQYFSQTLHGIKLDNSISLGWTRTKTALIINPIIYFDQFKKGFDAGGPIWKWKSHTNKIDLKVCKYSYACDFIEGRSCNKNPIRKAIEGLRNVQTQDLLNYEKKLKDMILEEFQKVECLRHSPI